MPTFREWSVNGFALSYNGNGELIVVGPNNHVYLGCSRNFSQRMSIQSVTSSADGELKVSARTRSAVLRCKSFIQGDVRTYRAMRMNSGVVAARKVDELSSLPELRPQSSRILGCEIQLRRSYGQYFYKAQIVFPVGTKILKSKTEYIVTLPKRRAEVIMYFATNDLRSVSHLSYLRTPPQLKKRISGLNSAQHSALYRLLENSMREIQLMLKWGKTSGDRFGTIFPRDWMETADIGREIFPQAVIDLLYSKAMLHVNARGAGWHEDVVGELRERNRKEGKQTVNRDMIDIEPHYLLGLPYVSSQMRAKYREQFKALVDRVYNNAKKKQLLTFKKITQYDRLHHDVFSASELKGKIYLPRGNWRDITSSFGEHAQDAVAPFDVNAAFIPQALLYALEYKILPHTPETLATTMWWQSTQDMYRFSNSDGSIAFGLCRYGKNGRLLAINHLDEAYYYFYRKGTEQDLASFAQRISDPRYLYTAVGPVITAFNNTIGLDTRSYHGTVIWPKQTAFAVLALSKHIKIAEKEGWSTLTLQLLRNTLRTTVLNSIKAYIRMGEVPELYVCRNDKPVSFMTQRGTSEESSSVQLWSAIAIHAMIKEYLKYF